MSNYIGTHFWNAQESYFTYGDDAEEPIVNHDISFREGVSRKVCIVHSLLHSEANVMLLKGEPMFCPRLILFDRKCKPAVCMRAIPKTYGYVAANFASLSDLHGDIHDDKSGESLSQWSISHRTCHIVHHQGLSSHRNGDIVEYHHDVVGESDYHARLDSVDERSSHKEKEDTDGDKESYADESKIRYWADYSRVFFHPHSIQRLPDPPEWDTAKGNWARGCEEFERMNEVYRGACLPSEC